MNIRRIHAVFLGFAVALAMAATVQAHGLPQTQPAEVGLSPERLQRLSTTLQQYVDEERIAGAVVLVARRGKVAHLQAVGFRDREAKSAMREDSIFRIASQTKALVSVGIMMLMEQGKLLLADPLSKYLPEFRETTVAVARDGGGYEVVKANRPITIHDLLTHTSGIGYGMGPAADQWKKAGIQGWYFADREEPVSAVVARMAALPFDAQPGERFVYGYSIDILGVVIERISGKTLDEFLRENITGPLEMHDTHFFLPGEERDRLAAVYSVSDSGSLERAPNTSGSDGQGAYIDGPRKAFSGGAGLLSTANDYARFLQMMLNGGTLDGKRILSRKSVELMTTDHLGPVAFRPGSGFGLGFSVVKDVGLSGVPGSKGEYGWGGAYHSTYWVDPREALVVVYLTQTLPAGDLDDFGKVRALVYQAIID